MGTARESAWRVDGGQGKATGGRGVWLGLAAAQGWVASDPGTADPSGPQGT